MVVTMGNTIITQQLIDDVVRLLEAETSFKKDSISFEIQDDGQFLLISISVDTLSVSGASSTFKRVGQLLNDMMPTRKGNYSWMVNFTRDGKVADSYFGGDSECPGSGL